MLGKNGERGRHVFVLDENLRRDVKVRRCEVPDGLDAVLDQQVTHALRGCGRDRQNADEDLPAAAQILQRGEGEDRLAAGVRPGDGGVGVKGCDDVQAVFRKAAVLPMYEPCMVVIIIADVPPNCNPHFEMFSRQDEKGFAIPEKIFYNSPEHEETRLRMWRRKFPIPC